ncbi:MAG: hypothetical protein ACON4N_01355 [Myxococcota bacterium]
MTHDPVLPAAYESLFGLATDVAALDGLQLVTYVRNGRPLQATLRQGAVLSVAVHRGLGPRFRAQLGAEWTEVPTSLREVLNTSASLAGTTDGLVIHLPGRSSEGKTEDALLSFRDIHGLMEGIPPVRRRLWVQDARHIVVACEQNAGERVRWELTPLDDVRWVAMANLQRGQVGVRCVVDPARIPDIDPVAAADRGWGMVHRGDADPRLVRVWLEAARSARQAYGGAVPPEAFATVDSAHHWRTRTADYSVEAIEKRLAELP